jgi:hypothetical protein
MVERDRKQRSRFFHLGKTLLSHSFRDLKQLSGLAPAK